MDLRAAVLFRPCAFDSQFSEPEPPGSAPAPLVEGTMDVHAAGFNAVKDQDGGAMGVCERPSVATPGSRRRSAPLRVAPRPATAQVGSAALHVVVLYPKVVVGSEVVGPGTQWAPPCVLTLVMPRYMTVSTNRCSECDVTKLCHYKRSLFLRLTRWNAVRFCCVRFYRVTSEKHGSSGEPTWLHPTA